MLGFFNRQRHIFRLEILHLNDLHNRFVVISPGRNDYSVTGLNGIIIGYVIIAFRVFPTRISQNSAFVRECTETAG